MDSTIKYAFDKEIIVMKENLKEFLNELTNLSNKYGLILEWDRDEGIEVLTTTRHFVSSGIDYDTQLKKYTTTEERYTDEEMYVEDDPEWIMNAFNQLSLVTLKTLKTSDTNMDVSWKKED